MARKNPLDDARDAFGDLYPPSKSIELRLAEANESLWKSRPDLHDKMWILDNGSWLIVPRQAYVRETLAETLQGLGT